MSITQANQNDKQISKSIKRFFTRFHISSALKASNAYKKKGIPVVEVFQYLFLLFFSNRSMYMSLITGRNTPGFAKDTVYRFIKIIQINWIRFTTLSASRITTIYNQNKKRRGRSRYLLSVSVDVVKDGEVIRAKVVYK